MSPALPLRAAVERDLDAVVAIERASFSDPWSREFFADALRRPGVLFDVACDAEGAVAGYVVAWFVADEGEIANLAVAPPRRRGGVGARLLDRVIHTARAAGTRTIHLEVRESNTAARGLYARYGFAEVGRRRGYYRRPAEDALRLRLTMPHVG